MVEAIKAHPDIAERGLADPVASMHQAWNDMSKGSHPTGFGLSTTAALCL
jgi:hypothetical protein